MSAKPTHDQLIEIAHEPHGELAKRFAEPIANDPKLARALGAMRAQLDSLKTPLPAAEPNERARARRVVDDARPQGAPLFGLLKPLPAFGFAALLAIVVALVVIGLGDGNAPDGGDPDHGGMLALRPANPEAVPVQGSIRAMHGRAAVKPAPESSPRELTREQVLETGVAVQMDMGASIFAKLGNGEELLFNEAVFAITRADDHDIVLDLARGSVAAKVRKLGPKQTFIVRTPEVSVAVTGTYFAVAYNPETGNVIVVREGSVAVTPHKRPEKRVTVTAGSVLLLDSRLMAVSSKLDGPSKTDRFFVPAEPRDPGQPLPGYEVTQRGQNADKTGAQSEQAQAKTPQPSPLAEAVRPDAPKSADDPARKLLNEARLAQAERQFDAALKLLDTILSEYKTSPQAEEALYLKAENLVGLGQTDAALGILEHAAKTLTRAELVQAALYTRGHLLQDRMKDYDSALDVWDAYATRFPEGLFASDVAYAACTNRSQAGDHEGARSRCAAFVKHHPKAATVPQALILAGDATWALGDMTWASYYYGMYGTTDRKEQRAYALLRQAKALARIKRIDQARIILDKLISEFPSDPKAAEAKTILQSLGGE